MERFLLFIAAITPGLLLYAYGVVKTRSADNGEALGTGFFVAGVVMFAVSLLELGIEKLFGVFAPGIFSKAIVDAVFTAAIPEEVAKFLVVVFFAERHVDVRRFQDIIALTLAVSLGFATVENIFYVAVPSNWQATAALRSVTAVPMHAITGLIMGAFITRARLCPRKRPGWLAVGLIAPILVHAAYDYPLMAFGEYGSRWLIAFWLATLLLSATFGVMLCNRTLPLALEADQISGRGISVDASPRRVIILGLLLIIVSPVVAIFALSGVPNAQSNAAVLWLAGVAVSITPIAFGIDLAWSGLRRRSHA